MRKIEWILEQINFLAMVYFAIASFEKAYFSKGNKLFKFLQSSYKLKTSFYIELFGQIVCANNAGGGREKVDNMGRPSCLLPLSRH